MRTRGFTLIEVLVVVALIVIVIGVVGLALDRTRAGGVQEETERLAGLVRLASEEAILQGRPSLVAFEADGYAFLSRDREGKWVPVQADEALRPRKLPPGLRIASVTVEGENDIDARVLISPVGEMPDFAVVLTDGIDRVRLEGANQGELRIGAVR